MVETVYLVALLLLLAAFVLLYCPRLIRALRTSKEGTCGCSTLTTSYKTPQGQLNKVGAVSSVGVVAKRGRGRPRKGDVVAKSLQVNGVKRGRGRPRKVVSAAVTAGVAVPPVAGVAPVKRGRGRPPKKRD